MYLWDGGLACAVVSLPERIPQGVSSRENAHRLRSPHTGRDPYKILMYLPERVIWRSVDLVIHHRRNHREQRVLYERDLLQDQKQSWGLLEESTHREGTLCKWSYLHPAHRHSRAIDREHAALLIDCSPFSRAFQLVKLHMIAVGLRCRGEGRKARSAAAPVSSQECTAGIMILICRPVVDRRPNRALCTPLVWASRSKSYRPCTPALQPAHSRTLS